MRRPGCVYRKPPRGCRRNNPVVAAIQREDGLGVVRAERIGDERGFSSEGAVAIFSQDELRKAIRAIRYLDEHGDPAELQRRINEATKDAPARDPYDNVAAGARINGETVARRVANLLDVPIEQADWMAAEVFGVARQRMAYAAIVEYATELYRAKNGNSGRRQGVAGTTQERGSGGV